MFIIPLILLAAPPLVAGYLKYRKQRDALEKPKPPAATSAKQRLDRE